MSIKLIATDMDDTLLDRDFNISKRNAEAIQMAMDKGVIVMIATGRMYRSARPYALELGLEVPLVTYNGALVKTAKSGEVFYENPLPLETARKVLGYCKEHSYYIQAYVENELLVKEQNDFSRRYTRISGIPALDVGDELYNLEKAPYKLLAMTQEDEFMPVWKDVQARFTGEIEVTSSKDCFLEIMKPGVNKWRAISSVAETYGIAADEIMCLGDSNNDLSMIKNAGIGVAVANAHDNVKELADMITLSNNDNGVAVAIEKVIG